MLALEQLAEKLPFNAGEGGHPTAPSLPQATGLDIIYYSR